MIPKIVHYCWFGRGPKNQLAMKCIDSWKRILPDYEIKEWNEDNFDVNLYSYVREALENRMFAFVTDVVRLYALYTEGGVYMDADVEVLKSYNPFLYHTMFSGFETDGNVPTGVMAAVKGSQWAKDLLDQYDERHFVKKDGSFDMTTNTVIITRYMIEKGLKLNNTYQYFPDFCTFYPSDYFCPKDHRTGEICITKNTVCIHHFAGSWLKMSIISRLRHSLKGGLVKLFGARVISKLSDIIMGRI